MFLYKLPFLSNEGQKIENEEVLSSNYFTTVRPASLDHGNPWGSTSNHDKNPEQEFYKKKEISFRQQLFSFKLYVECIVKLELGG